MRNPIHPNTIDNYHLEMIVIPSICDVCFFIHIYIYTYYHVVLFGFNRKNYPLCVCAYVHLDVYMYNWDGKIYFYMFVCIDICISVILYCLP